MSYDIDTWKVKKIKDLKIPIEAFFTHDRRDWHPELIYSKGLCPIEGCTFVAEGDCEDALYCPLHGNPLVSRHDLTVVLACEFGQVKGKVIDGMLFCKEIQCQGEGSGTVINWIIEPALKESTGELFVSCVWEGGDCINRLTVRDGLISWEKIDI